METESNRSEKKVDLQQINMGESDEGYVNGDSKDDSKGNSDNDDTKSSDQFVDMPHENPFVKFVRGFANVPDESVRKMRFESFSVLNE